MERRQLRVMDIVQGVGFRPFVHALATRLRLMGSIVNDSEGVTIDLQGAPAHLDDFETDLVARAPRLAVIHQVSSRTLPTPPATTFTIGQSHDSAERSALCSMTWSEASPLP